MQLQMSRSRTTIEELIQATLRGEAPSWPADPQWSADTFIERVAVHGVESLLHSYLVRSDWPIDVLNHLRLRALHRAMWELRHQEILAQTLATLDRNGIQPVLIKGTALAYSLYADPALRTRGDTDLIIPIDAKQRVHEVLQQVGYQRSAAVSGEFISYQASYTREADAGQWHTLDVHWKINNSEVLSRLFNYEELHAGGTQLLELCPDALRTSNVHALIIACMHRCTHRTNPYYVNDEPYYTADRLIWLYDLHLLANALSDAEWEQVARLAEAKGLRAVCLAGLQQARACFNTDFPVGVLSSLMHNGKSEAPAVYLSGTRVRQAWMDLLALGTIGNGLRFAQELAFPAAAYMRDKYPDQSSMWLPWLYLRRAASGITKRVMARQSAP